MNDIITTTLVAIGGIFGLLAAIGIVRMPDLYMRMQAATKAATLGVACVMLASAVHFADLGTTARAVLVVLFLFLTAPVAAHTIARAAYIVGAALWEGTVTDELRNRYERETHELRSRDAERHHDERRRAVR